MESAIAAVIFDYRGVITSPPGEGGEVRPQMVAALDRLAAHGYRLACITNNTRGGRGDEAIFARFEQVLESARAGVRKPDPRIYLMMCEKLGLEPADCVYLDDLGINCKPAAALGMHAIKVTSGEQALADLSAALGLELAAG